MDTGTGQGVADKKSRDEFVDIPSYVEPDTSAAGLSARQKLFYHGSGIAVGLLMAVFAFAGWRYFQPGVTEYPAPPSVPHQVAANAPLDTNTAAVAANQTSPVATDEDAAPRPHVRRARANAGADVVAAAKPASGIMYVHRNNSDLRPAPSTSSEPIKKLAKGEKVQLLALSDKWAQVDDSGTKGWVRASVIKDTPPGEKKSRKKKADDE